jgi:hypothetical protein
MKVLGIRDLKAFEEDWKSFILGLSLQSAEDFNSGHR